ncbi:phosphomannomutase/phosphoglucomutase [Aquisalimonas sp. 2447]|uniref:phosphomannomutase/phosphoglucomutase n=1 Tax=Aquisalimonas sp. 2447 TaxID=2740807 RepID=UPI002738340C|nr:phosphomannomutase/phosphoglucomutase [Aquisalimonas sp. 2447]
MSAGTSTGPGKRGNARVSLVAGVALLTLLLLAVVAAALWFVRDAAEQAREAERGDIPMATAGLLAAQVQSEVSGLKRRLALAAEQPDLADALEDGSGDVMQAAVAGLRPAFPGAIRLALFPAGHDSTELDADPPVGYALLDMLRAAESGAEQIGPEGHRLGSDDAHVNLVQPVGSGGEVVGHVVLSLPPDWMRATLGAGDVVEGGVELLQGSDGVVHAQGVGNAPSLVHTARVPGTDWRVRFEPASAGTPYRPLADPWFLTVVGIAGALIVLIMAVAGRALGRARARDSRAWAGLVEDAAAGTPASTYTAGWPETQKELDAARERAVDTAQSRPAAASAVAAEENTGALQAASSQGITVEEISAEHDNASSDHEPAAVEGSATSEEESAVKVDPSLFRAYDIRGVVGKTLSRDVVREIGRSIGSEAAARGCTDVVVGRDGRLSSPELAEALIEGLAATGRQVIDIGQVPTPVMYFATHHLGTGTGVEITGSHNPPDYNGMKIMIGGETLSGDAITGLHRRLQAGDLHDGEGSVRRQDLAEDYIDAIASDITLHRPLRVVLDAGNGVGGAIGPRVLQAIGCEVEPLYCEVDGNFPNHHPDPSDPHNLEALIRLVRLQQADVGLALDGDGDRLGVVDATGKIIWADRQMMLYARDVLTRNPGADIVFDVKCSSQLAQVISENAGVPVMWRTGHSLIKAKLKESGAPLAGEMSGHIFFNDRWPGFDDGIYTAARLLEILSMEEQSSTEVFAALPEAVSTPEIKVDLEEGEPPQVIERLVAAASFPDARVTTIDGLRVDFPDGWGLVRSSNTTPCLVLRFEGDDEAALERIRASFRELLEQARPGLELPF